MQWITDEQRARGERYNRKLAPVLASLGRMGEHGKAMQQGGMRMVWAGVKMMLGVLLLGIFIMVLISVL